MKCPFCGFRDSKVVDSYRIVRTVRRRRMCLSCKKRWNTEEVIIPSRRSPRRE